MNELYFPDGSVNSQLVLEHARVLIEHAATREDFLLAKKMLQLALTAPDTMSQTHFLLGRCWLGLQNNEKAEQSFLESIAYEQNRESFEALAQIFISRKEDEKAAQWFLRVLDTPLKSQEKFTCCQAIGNCYFRAKHMELAQQYYLQALDYNPYADEVRSNLGMLYIHRQEMDQAKRCFQDALACNPKNYHALSGLGICAMAENKHEEAHDHFAKALALELNNPTALFYLVKCSYVIRSFGIAEKMVRAYIDTRPAHADLLYSLAGLQFQMGKIPQSYQTVRKALQIQSNHSAALALEQRLKKLMQPPQGTTLGGDYQPEA